MSADSITALLSEHSPTHLQRLFAESPQHAAAWVRALALEGMLQAQTCYGRMLLAGTGTAEDRTAALLWFKRAADHGDPDALNMVGRCLENGWGADVDAPCRGRLLPQGRRCRSRLGTI